MQIAAEHRPEADSRDSLNSADAVIADANRVNGESIAWCLNAYGGFRNVSTVTSSAEMSVQPSDGED